MTQTESVAGLRLELGRLYLVFGGPVRLIEQHPQERRESYLTFRQLSTQDRVTISLSAWRELCYAGAVVDA